MSKGKKQTPPAAPAAETPTPATVLWGPNPNFVPDPALLARIAASDTPDGALIRRIAQGADPEQEWSEDNAWVTYAVAEVLTQQRTDGTSLESEPHQLALLESAAKCILDANVAMTLETPAEALIAELLRFYNYDHGSLDPDTASDLMVQFQQDVQWLVDAAKRTREQYPEEFTEPQAEKPSAA